MTSVARGASVTSTFTFYSHYILTIINGKRDLNIPVVNKSHLCNHDIVMMY